ncbi:MAG: hypothetical protein IJ848_04245, partial [Alphaproteobacteria bacterium]|nr:hypothetical protein [Alphaproteobacteria bacterium]
MGAIPVRVENNDNNISFGDNDNNFIIPNDEQTQDNNIPDNVNVGNSIEATQNNNINNNEKQYFN